jgi:hypothetical protein
MNVVNSELEPNLKSYSQLREEIIQNNNVRIIINLENKLKFQKISQKLFGKGSQN